MGALDELRTAVDRLAGRAYVRSRTARASVLTGAMGVYARLALGLRARRSEAEAARLRELLVQLFEDDWRDARAGYYPERLVGLPWAEYARAAPRLLADAPRVRARRRRHEHDDLDPAAAPERYPRYYARNFHYQTDGYLGHASAAIYDLQVELLFGGTADAMRRRLVPPVVDFARAGGFGRARPLKLLDVACGTGHLLRMLGQALPSARLVGVDLSPHYVARARALLPKELDLSLVVDNAEALPFPAAHFDVVTNLFLLHELPPQVRARVLGEVLRVLKPGGRAVIADSLQLRDAPVLEDEIENFPRMLHEPYYLSFVKDDLAARLAEAGLVVESERLAFLTKVVVARKP